MANSRYCPPSSAELVPSFSPTDTLAKLSPISSEVTHVFWVAFQLYETEELNVAKNSAMLRNVLDALTKASPSRLRHVTLQTGTKHYMGPIFDPSLAGKLVHHEPPFVEDSSISELLLRFGRPCGFVFAGFNVLCASFFYYYCSFFKEVCTMRCCHWRFMPPFASTRSCDFTIQVTK
ncbi:hypothetical protein Patl1_26353 [Pistacia atlantica]|uniref:Uncharacterized protein n=1 Tax=Pistacia atlantica TaxID=434234 RepID=A0ACC1B0Q7_9ROSI|nr:hypothetical protein Patl1_26353 [Pistacia atlantica]